MTSKRLTVIRKRIGSIKAQLASIEDMRPGSLTRQYKDPENRNEPYYQLSYTRQMRSRTEYVPRDYLPEVRREIRNYKRFKALTIERRPGWHRVRPEVVLEVTFDTVQRSARHSSGYALRFPRIVRVRDDKPVAEIDTLARVRELAGE